MPKAPPEKKPAAKPPKAAAKAAPPARITPAPAKAYKPTVAFPKKNQPPAPAAFAARLPLPLGRRFEMVRTFLLKQKGVTEDLHFYGPNAGWALRYLVDERPFCSLHLHDEHPVGIVSVDPPTLAAVDWNALSPVAQKAKRIAHGSPSLLWLDVPLDGTGATDFRDILRSKLAMRTAEA